MDTEVLKHFSASTQYIIQAVEKGEPVDILLWATLRDMEKISKETIERYREIMEKIHTGEVHESWMNKFSEDFLKGQAFGL